MEPIINDDTITAISTPSGVGGIAVVRISGKNAIEIVNRAWKGVDLTKVTSHTLHLGSYVDSENRLIDEAVASIFIAPRSFTGENVVELSVHGSTWIQKEILLDLVKRGARIANPGEFTQRAFLNGKIDLAQAEGIADLISAQSKAAHDMAINQTKGKFSKEFAILRDKLIEFASLIELELDFSEEEVEFADRSDLIILLKEILNKINNLASSFSQGEVIKKGVPVVIAGVPNAGKSSLLNLLLNDDKAIVTDIPGTTRDIIEDTTEINGILYRFIDTAGIRETTDTVEGIGVNKAKSAIEKAFIIIWMVDPSCNISIQMEELSNFLKSHHQKNVIILLNKSDLNPDSTELEEQINGLINKFIPNFRTTKLYEDPTISTPESSMSIINDYEDEANIHEVKENARGPQDVTENSYGYQEAKGGTDRIQEAKGEADGLQEAKVGAYGLQEAKGGADGLQEAKVGAHVLQGLKKGDRDFKENIQESKKNSYISNDHISIFPFSTKTLQGLEFLRVSLEKIVKKDHNPETDIIITNARHFEALKKASQALERALSALTDSTPSDLLAQEIREATSHLSEITGSITSTTLLHSIFSRFCIGK